MSESEQFVNFELEERAGVQLVLVHGERVGCVQRDEAGGYCVTLFMPGPVSDVDGVGHTVSHALRAAYRNGHDLSVRLLGSLVKVRGAVVSN